MAYTIEHIYKVYDDSTGSYIEVCPNRDGLPDLYDIRYIEFNGTEISSFTVDISQMNKLAEVLRTICLDSERRS